MPGSPAGRRARRLPAVALLSLAAFGSAALAENYPSRPVKLIVPFAPGGSSDILGRVFADKLGAELGQPIVVDNRAGGNTVIGTLAAANSKGDGYTLLQVTPNAAIVSNLQPNLGYDLQRDFVPVIGVGSVPLLLVVPAKSNIRSIADLVALAKSTPGGLSYASGGIGSLGHLAPAQFIHELKVSGTHVPYKGVAPAIQDVVGNRIQLMFVSGLEGMQMVRAGAVRVLGVTSDQRMPTLPETPTMAELGFADFKPAVWYGFVVPAGTPADIADRLYRAIAKASADPVVRDKLGNLGVTVNVRNGLEFGKFMREENLRWARVVSENNIKME